MVLKARTPKAIRQRLLRRLMRGYLRDFAKAKRRDRFSSGHVALGKLIGAKTIIHFENLLPEKDQKRIDARLDRIINANVTRGVRR